jgi:uncharacterized protein
LRASQGAGYAGIVFWFWFNWVLSALMIVADVGWWLVAMHFARQKVWRVLVTVFLAGQLAAHVSAVAGVGWPRHCPESVLLAAMLWHYFAVATLLPLGLGCVCVLALRRRARARAVRREGCVAAVGAGGALQTRREFLGAAAALTPPLFSIGLARVALAQLSNLRVRRFTLALPTLPQALDGITIAHLSDIHVGLLSSSQGLRQVVNTTNALRADLVLVTGDLIDYNLSDLSEGIALLRAIESRHGLWMIEGNHDLIEDGGEFERRVKAAGISLLLDETAVAEVRGYPVQIFGLRWMLGFSRAHTGGLDRVLASQVRLLLKQRRPEAFPILLAHHPHAFDVAVATELPLTLAGHTHGGQWMLDSQHGIGPIMFRYWSGLYTQRRSQMIVSNGAGNVFPIRLNAPTEIVHITLKTDTRG